MKVLGVIALWALIAPLTEAGVVFEQKSDLIGNAAASSVAITVYSQDGNIRVQRGDGKDGVIIIKRQTLIVINPLEKQYLRFDEASMAALAARTQIEFHPTGIALTDSIVLGIIEDTRAKVLAQQQLPRLSPTGKQKAVDGYPCEIWAINYQAGRKSEFCAADPVDVPLGREILNTYSSIGAFYDVAKASLGNAILLFVDFPLRQDSFVASQLGKIPVLWHTVLPSGDIEEISLRVIATKRIDLSFFEVPPNYDRVDNIETPMNNLIKSVLQ